MFWTDTRERWVVDKLTVSIMCCLPPNSLWSIFHRFPMLSPLPLVLVSTF